MLGKSNRVERLKQTMDQKPTFGFRKLSIGITSVMLGVTFFMAGGHTVFAKTSTSQTTENKTITSDQTTNTKLNNVEQPKDSTATDQTSQTQTNNENQTQDAKVDQLVSATDTNSNDKIKSTTNATDTVTEKTTSTTDPTATAPTNTGDKASNETNTPDSAKQITRSTTNSKVAAKLAALTKLAGATATSATTDSDLAVTDDNGITLSINRNTVGNDGTDGAPINIDLSGTFGAGEVYSIKVPVTTFGIDDSNFNNTIIFNRGVISKSDQTVDGQKYRNYKLTVSNDFTTTTGFKLVISDGNNYTGQAAATSSNAIDPAGEVKREISWGYVDPKKGEVKNKSLYFTTIIKDSMHPTFNQVKPSPNKVTQLQTNTNYDFQLNINQTTGLQNDTSYGSNKVNSAVNMGTTITIPVPGDFVIDPDASLRASGLVPDGKTTITQEKAGADIVITVAAGTGSQNWTGATGYHLVGKFMQPVEPFDNKIYTADGKIKIDQKVRTVNGISTISAMIDQPWSVNLVGPKVTPKQGDLATQIVGNNGSNTLFQKQPTNIVNYFGFTNDTSISFTNSLHIQVGFDENLAVTGIKTPDINDTLRPGLTSYQYVIEVVDKATQKHRFITASVDAGQVIAAPTGTTIYKADILPNYVEVGATTKMGSALSKVPNSNSGSTTQNEDPDVFEAYGYISDKLNNMATLPPDTTVSTKIAIRSADFNDNQTANSAVDQKVLGLDSLTAAMQAYAYQNSKMYDPTNPTKSAGSIDMHFDNDPKATTVKVFEPIFYYVLPKYFSFSGGWDAVQDKAKDANTGKVIEPKFETYMVDGRQVVKLDYTGTGFNYNTNDSQSHDKLSITIDPDGVAGDYYYDAFVYTKSGMSHYTTKYTATNLDDQTKAFTKNITNSDIPGSLYKLSYLYGNRFTIKSPVIAYVPNMAQGNEDPKAAVKGTSDTKGDGTMYYYVNVANYDLNVIKDGRLLINVPLASDNSTSFDFTVDGPVTYDSSYDKTFDNSFTFYYANDVQRLPSTKEKGIQPSLDNYVTGDQVKEWSKVKSIIVKFSKDIPAADQIGRFVIKGHDPNFKSDAGKTGYIRVALTGSNFTPFVSTDTGIQIVGKSTIDTRLHYVDANGEDQYIEVPSMAKTYVENKDVMNLADFDPKNIPSTLIPENYELSSSIPSFIITNSDDEAQNAGFGKQVKYYFNGDIVQFELKHKTKSEAKTIQDTTYYEYDDSSSKYQAGGTDDQNTIVVNGQKATPTSYTYSLKRVTDLVTGKATYYVVNTSTNESIAVDENGNFTIPGVKGLPSLSGYTANTADSTLAQTAKNYNINSLFTANPTTDQIVSKRVVHYIPDNQTLTYTMYNETQKKWITTESIVFLNGKTDDDASDALEALRKKVHDFLTPNAYKLDQIYYFDTGTGQQNIVYYDDSFDIKTGKLVAPGKFTGDPEKNNVILYVKDPVNYNQQDKAISRTIYYHDADQNDETLNNLPINPLSENDYKDTIIQKVNYKRFEVIDAITSAILGYYKPSQMELVDGSWKRSWKPKAGESYIPYDASDQYSGFEIDTENGNSSKQGAVTNYDLSKYGYEGPVDENGNAFLKVAEAVPSVDGKSTIVNVYYHHKLVTIAPDKLPTAGEKVDASDPNSPVYPTNNYDPNAAASQSSVQRIIHHVYANGTKINGIDVSGQAVAGLSDTIQTVTFYQDATIDLVTGKITYTGKYRAVKSATTQNGTTTSVPNYGQFTEVTSPSIANYKPVDATVDSANANLGDALKTVNVAYIADQTDAVITYIDADNDGSMIIADTIHGPHGSAIGYSTADRIKDLVAKGYELVTDGYSDDTSDDKYFDNSKIRTWTVTMRHKKLVIDPDSYHSDGEELTTPGYQGTYPQGVDKNDLNRTVSRTIKFQYADGTTWGGKDLSGQTVVDDQGQELKDIVQTVSYQRQATIDLVKLADPTQAKNAITYGDWHVKTGSNPDFASVDVLPVAGYEASQATVKEKTPTIDPVNGPENGKTQVVLYSPISQSVTMQFVDKNGNVIEPEYTFLGSTGQTVKVADPFGDPIAPPMGWKLVDPKTEIPTEVSFGKTPLANIRIEIEHATVHLNHDEFHEANTGTLPDNSIRPFPAGVDHDDLNQTVTRTIRVHMPDGTIKSLDQVLRFTRGATIDEINGNVTYDKWYALDGTTMDAVKATDIVATPAGYSPMLEAVKLTGVDPNDQDTIVDISYEPNTQNAQLRIVDDDALVDGQPKELFTTSSSGKFGTNVYFDNLKDELDKLTNENYQIDMSGLPENSKYQADDNNNNFVIHVKHRTAPAIGSRAIREKISYVYVDQNGVEHTIHDDYITDAADRVVFIQHGTLDLVTDTYTWQHDWTSTTGKFVKITSPEIQGYVVRPGMEAVPAQEVAIDGENGDKISVVNDQLGGKIAQTNTDPYVQAWVISYKIYYNAAPQSTKVTYVDDDEQDKVISSNEVTGHTFETVATGIANPDPTKYYLVDSDKLPDEIVFSTTGYPKITVHLKHKHTQVNRSVTYDRTINFVDEAGKQMADPEKQTLTFNQAGDKDLATGTIKWVPVDSQSFEEVAAKDIPGYTSNKQSISAETVSPSDGDFSENHSEKLTITYKADPQTVKVVYVDDDSNGSQIGNTQTVSGVTDETVSTNISNPDPTKYEIVDADKLPETVTLKPDDERVVTVHLKHKHIQVNRSVTYERTVNFVDETGKQMADPEKQDLTFNQTGAKDLATGTIKWNPVDSQSFDEVMAKDIPGYTSDKQSISAEKIAPSDSDFSEAHTENLKITYKADPQTVKVVYVDDDNNGSQIGDTQTVSGVTDETVSTNISNPDSTKYEIVNGDKLPETVTLKPNDETIITVHIKHKLADTNRTLKTTRTIVYVNEQGKQMADPVNQTLIFTQTGKKDLVTGEITWDPDYTQSLTWKAVTSPQIAGYTPDLTKVDEQTETVKDADFIKGHDQMVVVTYSANDQSTNVVYVDDDKHGATIDSETITGKTDQTVLTNVVNPDDTKYELVSGYATEITFGPNKHPEVIVHVRHKKENVTRTKDVTLTVTFELPDGTQVKKTATINFIQNGVKDLATGETTWQGDYQASSKFATITAPEVPGYHPTSTAGGQVITVNTNNWDKDLDLNQVITYEADPSNQPDIPITPSEPVSPENQPDQNTPSPKLEPTPDDEPAKPTTNDKPNKGKPHVQGFEEHGHQANRVTQPHGEVQNHARRVAQPNVEQQVQGQLPQTGEKANQTGLLGLALVGLSSLLALLGVKKKEHK